MAPAPARTQSASGFRNCPEVEKKKGRGRRDILDETGTFIVFIFEHLKEVDFVLAKSAPLKIASHQLLAEDAAMPPPQLRVVQPIFKMRFFFAET